MRLEIGSKTELMFFGSDNNIYLLDISFYFISLYE
jgi:hypothetical protein